MSGKGGGGVRFFLLMFLLALPVTVFGEYRTIDELAKAYSDEACKSCHARVHEEWSSSYHARSVVNSLGILREFIEVGLKKDWKKPVNREELMRCMGCHAPQLKDASESLIGEVARLAVAAAGEKEGGEARKSLERLSVNCVVCHNTMAGVERNLKGAPVPGVYYGPAGKATPAHGTRKSAALTSSLFCGQCHGIYTPPDREIVFCTSLYESYQDAYRANGGLKSCQECHMRAKGRGHRTPGSHQAEIVREGIGLEVDAAGVRLTPGQWTPAVLVSATLSNRAGHRTPDG
ncbi:MAG: hypothetical protein FD174_3488 [Geobacteraceae bacterium]|nr:MAG: hypothetical protein FD174_3488 [Geobacteraceae bacterium]